MKNRTKLIATALVLIASASGTFAQSTSTATATATIVTPISITKTVDMNFGNVAVQVGTGGTVLMPPAGVRSVTGGVTLPPPRYRTYAGRGHQDSSAGTDLY